MKSPTLMLAMALCGCGGGGGSATPTTPPATEHLITYGQSLSLGERAVISFPTNAEIPTSDTENVGLMFKGGTHPEDLSELVPFEESNAQVSTDWNISTPGETPLYGALLTLKGMDTSLHIGSTAGRGGTAIANLSKGSAPYSRVLAQVGAAKVLSPGKYSVIGIIWMQGESDPGNLNYSGEFAQLIMDLDTDIRVLTGQGPIQFYVCTPAVSEIAAQQRAVAASNPNVHIVCNDTSYDKSDGTHLTAASSRAIGIVIGNAIKEIVK